MRSTPYRIVIPTPCLGCGDGATIEPLIRHYYKTALVAGDKKAAEEEQPEPEKITKENIFSLTEEQLIQMGENKRLEFKSTLRYGIEPGKDEAFVEQTVLKTVAAFLNSEGGTLLVGVKDVGKALGIELDHFLNEDKYLLHFSNLINTRFGRQFTDYISWEIRELQGKKILRVNCKRSPNPVFIKVGERDGMYIRSGPAITLLSAKEVLEYSKSHIE
jgi:predicted HTH transcriptional regulator